MKGDVFPVILSKNLEANGEKSSIKQKKYWNTENESTDLSSLHGLNSIGNEMEERKICFSNITSFNPHESIICLQVRIFSWNSNKILKSKKFKLNEINQPKVSDKNTSKKWMAHSMKRRRRIFSCQMVESTLIDKKIKSNYIVVKWKEGKLTWRVTWQNTVIFRHT